jgi:type I restriction enzyme S subunit
MKNQNNIPPGFKTSSLGPIPNDWEVKELGKSVDVLTGYAFTSVNFLNSGIKLLRGSNVKRNEIDWKPSITQHWIDDSPELGKYKLIIVDLVIALDGALIGRSFAKIQQKDLPCYLVQRVARLRSNKINQDFLHVLFTQRNFEVYVDSVKTNTAIPHISPLDIKKHKVVLPPLPEQTAIANCLSTWDKAITATTALITQKELRKKWLMQQLLTGKKRLPGFRGEWTLIHISDVSKEVSIKNKEDKEIPVLSCTKYDGLVPSLEYFGRKIFADDLTTYKVVPKNHFAYATNHIEEGSIGYQDNFDEALISPMYTVFKTDTSINDWFFYKLLKSYRCVYEYQAWMEGSIDRRGGLRWDSFSKIKVSIPPIEEQTAIAKVIQLADKEINLLKTKLEKLKEQKRGLMRVLLTGRKRLNTRISN